MKRVGSNKTNKLSKSDDVDFVRKPWQSFSTMKRFVNEANRLENASWRLWYMQQMKDKERVEVQEKTKFPHMNGNGHNKNMVVDEEDEPDRVCVYCEITVACLTCNGCCHDAYCISCFKLIHMRGHLATHTAVKLQQAKHHFQKHQHVRQCN